MCTQERACRFYERGVENVCSWLHGTVPRHTVCTAPVCLHKWAREQQGLKWKDERRRARGVLRWLAR